MAVIILVMGLVIFQDLFQFKKLTPLAGYYTNPKDVAFSWSGWKSGKYQEQKEAFLSKGFHLREDFVRFNNSLHYYLFKTSNIDWVVFGRGHHLMDKKQIDAYLGKDSISLDEIQRTTFYLKQLQDTLQKIGKQIFVVVPPNKPSIYPELMPGYMKEKTITNNYTRYSTEFNKNKINYIDLVYYFHQLKLEGYQDLFAINGSHWNSYGAAHALVYTMKYINKFYNNQLGTLEIKRETYKKERPCDLDIYVTLNLFSTQTKDTTLDPEILIKKTDAPRPRALFISDSFFDAWIEMGAYDFFDSTTYYFYNDNIIGKDRNGTHRKLTIKESLKQYDVFIILCNESNLDELSWGFIHQMHFQFYPNAPNRILYDKYYQKKIKETIDFIKQNDKWYSEVKEKAAKNNMLVDKQLYLDAVWSLEQETKLAQY